MFNACRLAVNIVMRTSVVTKRRTTPHRYYNQQHVSHSRPAKVVSQEFRSLEHVWTAPLIFSTRLPSQDFDLRALDIHY